MSRLISVTVLAVGIILVASSSPQAADAGDTPEGWHTSVAAARKTAEEENRPMIVFVTAKWCGHCRRMEKDTLSDDRVSRRVKEQFVPLVIDVDEHPDLAKRLKISALPSTLVFDADGKLVDRTIGYLSPSKAITWLDKLSSTSDAKASHHRQASHAQ